jgi:CrcB protein
MFELISVGTGGFLGACLRFLTSKALAVFDAPLPLGTLVSNVAAGFLIGLFIGFERNNTSLQPQLKLFLTTGLLGGLSTFSTFSLETITLIESASYLNAAANILLNLGLSLAAVVLGFAVSKICFNN